MKESKSASKVYSRVVFSGASSDNKNASEVSADYIRLISKLSTQLFCINDQMNELINRFNVEYKPPRLAKLSPVRRPDKTIRGLYWRIVGPGGEQLHCQVFLKKNQSGQVILDNMPPDLVDLLASYEISRVDLNLRSSILQKTISTLEKSIIDLEGVEERRPGVIACSFDD